MPSSSSRVLAGTPEEVFDVGDVPDSATGRLGQVLPGLLAQGDPLGGLLGISLLGVGGFSFIIAGLVYTACFADGLSPVGAFAYGCPGVARFRALGRAAGYDLSRMSVDAATT